MKIKKRQLNQLRDIIREVLILEANPPNAAGIIVVKKFDDVWKILGLKSSKSKHKGMYDLTKGLVDPGESKFEAATRETQEESGIDPSELNFEWGKISTLCNNITLYIASTKSEPFIRPNPKTGKMEHTSADWLNIDEFESQCIGYLRPVAGWARRVLDVK